MIVSRVKCKVCYSFHFLHSSRSLQHFYLNWCVIILRCCWKTWRGIYRPPIVVMILINMTLIPLVILQFVPIFVFFLRSKWTRTGCTENNFLQQLKAFVWTFVHSHSFLELSRFLSGCAVLTNPALMLLCHSPCWSYWQRGIQFTYRVPIAL